MTCSRFCGVVSGLLILSAFICYAQDCTDGFQENVLSCTDGEGCNDRVATFCPNDSQYGVTFQCDAEECCGELLTSCFTNGGGCEPEILKQPEFKKELDQLALVSDLLVEDCAGHYVAYQPSQTPSRNRIALRRSQRELLIDDRLWR